MCFCSSRFVFVPGPEDPGPGAVLPRYNVKTSVSSSSSHAEPSSFVFGSVPVCEWVHLKCKMCLCVQTSVGGASHRRVQRARAVLRLHHQPLQVNSGCVLHYPAFLCFIITQWSCFSSVSGYSTAVKRWWWFEKTSSTRCAETVFDSQAATWISLPMWAWALHAYPCDTQIQFII